MQSFAAILLFAVGVSSMADRPPPAYAPSPSYYKPSPSYRPEPSHPAQYSYAYDVQDDYAGVDFDAQESRDG